MINLQSIRKQRNLTQKATAEKLGIPARTYSSYENGDREPNIEMLIKLADFFNVTADELIGHTAEQQLFDNARIEKPYYVRLFEAMSEMDKAKSVGYMEGLLQAKGIVIEKKN